LTACIFGIGESVLHFLAVLDPDQVLQFHALDSSVKNAVEVSEC
jgi:hypothetical protein